MQSTNSQRIISNTIILYIRMLIIMVVSMYTARVLLDALGVEDYGLYNVVGGVVSLFAFLMSSMASATQRFLSFYIGKGNDEELRDVFSMSLTTHLFIALIVVLLAETLGLWFLNTYIQIPDGRLHAANIVYQFVIASLFLNIVIVPYSACVIAHEKIQYYAYITIFDAIAKLLIAFYLLTCQTDKLCIYGLLLFVITLLDLLFYCILCRRYFIETKYRFFYDKRLFMNLFSFSGWTILGQSAVVGANQGTSILINMFHSVVYNAALGVANQLNGALNGLVSNFQTAFQPQITKSYAASEFDYMNRLIHNASKMSFFLLFVVAVPVAINIEWLLDLWLKEVPPLTGQFCILFMIASLFNSIGGPLWMSVFATGKIKNYQICVFIIYLLSILVIYLLFKFGAGPSIAVAITTLVSIVLLVARILYAKLLLPFFSIKNFVCKVLFPLAYAILTVLTSIFFLTQIFNFSNLLWVTSIIIFIEFFSVLFIGLSKEERINTFHLLLKILGKNA